MARGGAPRERAGEVCESAKSAATAACERWRGVWREFCGARSGERSWLFHGRRRECWSDAPEKARGERARAQRERGAERSVAKRRVRVQIERERPVWRASVSVTRRVCSVRERDVGAAPDLAGNLLIKAHGRHDMRQPLSEIPTSTAKHAPSRPHYKLARSLTHLAPHVTRAHDPTRLTTPTASFLQPHPGTKAQTDVAHSLVPHPHSALLPRPLSPTRRALRPRATQRASLHQSSILPPIAGSPTTSRSLASSTTHADSHHGAGSFIQNQSKISPHCKSRPTSRNELVAWRLSDREPDLRSHIVALHTEVGGEALREARVLFTDRIVQRRACPHDERARAKRVSSRRAVIVEGSSRHAAIPPQRSLYATSTQRLIAR